MSLYPIYRKVSDAYGTYLFVIMFVGISFFYGLDEIMFLRPQSMHAWRQADCLSITQYYYQHDNSFWQPEMHNQLSDDNLSGKTAGEFPLLYYYVATLWKVFGKSEFLYRLNTLLFAMISLLLVFRFSKEVLKSNVYAFFSGLLLMLSPVYVFYAANFLPNIPAISSVFIGWYFFWKFYKSDRDKYLWIAMLFFCLGFLTKVSSGISFFAIGGWFLIELMLKNAKLKIFIRPARQVIPMVLVLISVALWYIYAFWYNEYYDGKYTFNSVWPVWVLSYHETISALKGAYTDISPHFFEVSIFVLTGIFWIYLLATFKSRTSFLNYLLIIMPLGSFIYSMMWFQAFNVHDYYWIDFYPLFILVWVLFFFSARKNRIFNHWAVKMSFVALFVFNMFYCQKIVKARYDGWPVDPYINHMKAVGELEPILFDLGIGENDKIISMPDHSINVSLYLMNRAGATNYNIPFNEERVLIDRIKKGATFLVINDTAILKKEWLKTYINYPVKTYKNVKIFDLRPYLVIE